MHTPTQRFYEFGPFRLETSERRLLRNGQPVALAAKLFDILLVLVENHGHLLEKNDLIHAVWSDSYVEEGNLTRSISTLRKALEDSESNPRYIETVPKHGYRFVANVNEWPLAGAELILNERITASVVIEEESNGQSAINVSEPGITFSPRLSPPSQLTRAAVGGEELEPVGGAVALDSRFYIERSTDAEFRAAVARHDSIVLVKGARQVGKTSLLARSLQHADEAGARVALTDFQLFNASHLTSAEILFLILAKSIAEQLDLPGPDQMWDPDLSPSMNFTRYVRREVLRSNAAPLVWCLDEVDRLFTCDFGSEVFGLFRSWHNARSLDLRGPWRRLTLAMAYATEAHLFITDMYQSPFNVGTRLLLEDFTLPQVAELNHRYGFPLSEPEIARYFHLVGGHPYLVRCGLHEMVTHGLSFTALRALADHDGGPFGDHLRRLLISLTQDATLCEVVRGVLRDQLCPSAESFYRLRTAGVIVGDSPRDVRLRCQLYADYLEGHLL
jgi:DNA-binding winged helix-turn-helix (wHTH) protein